MHIDLHRRLPFLVAAAITASAPGCDTVPTTSALPAAAGAELSVMSECSPYIAGPDSLAATGEATYNVFYPTANGCVIQSTSWSVDNGAQILWVQQPPVISASLTGGGSETAPAGHAFGGRARVKAGQCDFTISSSSTFTSSSANAYHGVRVRDCGPLNVSLTTGSFGGIQVSWNAVRADSFRVYRQVAGQGSWTHVATRTSTSWTDTAYRIANRFDYTHYLHYRVDAYQNGGYFGLTGQSSTWAKPNASID